MVDKRVDCERTIQVIKEEIVALERLLASQEDSVNAHKALLASCEAEVAKTRADIEACSQTIEILDRQWRAAMLCDSSPVPQSIICGGATVADIMDCETQYSALRKIADICGGQVVLSDAADLWLASMKSKGSKTSVLTSFRRGIKQSGDWVKVSKGIYKLRLEALIDRTEGSESSSATQPPDMNSEPEDVSERAAA